VQELMGEASDETTIIYYTPNAFLMLSCFLAFHASFLFLMFKMSLHSIE
jgi:hypothetical protein